MSKPPGTANRNRLPCFGMRFSSPRTSTISMFRVSSTTRPSRCAWLGSLAPITSTRKPISSCFRRFTVHPSKPCECASTLALLSRGNRLLTGGGDLPATEEFFLPHDRENPGDVLPESPDLSRVRPGSPPCLPPP